MKKWYTLSPVSFRADRGFWGRDAGLYSLTLREMGYESRVIMPLPAHAGEEGPPVLRATFEELCSPDWWRALELDGVIALGWARHVHTPIMRAIRESGVCSVLCIDSNGTHFPLNHQWGTVKTLWRFGLWTGNSRFKRWLMLFREVTRYFVVMLLKRTYLKYRHLCYPDLIVCQTPASEAGHQWLGRFFGGKSHRLNPRHIGCPVSTRYRWDPSVKKEKRVIAIGRWDDLRQKRPHLMMEVFQQATLRDRDLKIDIFGGGETVFEKWYGDLEKNARDRITIHGVQPPEVLLSSALRSQVLFSSSSSESGPYVLFELLCCGATSVFLDSRDLPGAQWVAQESGHIDLVPRDTVEAYVETLESALKKWENGAYRPEEISSYWIPRSHVDVLVRRVIDLALQSRKTELSASCLPAARVEG